MNQNLLILLTRILVLAEAIAAVTGFITWHKWKNSYLKWVPLYLAVITILELINRFYEYADRSNESVIVAEIAVVLEMLFVNGFFYKTVNTKNKIVIWIGFFTYAGSFIAEKSFINSAGYYFQSLSYTVGNLFILIYLILFYIELARSANILFFKKLTTFWIATGMLLFYLGSFPFYGLFSELGKNIDLFIKVAYVATFLNYCMYLFFIIGFIWGKAK